MPTTELGDFKSLVETPDEINVKSARSGEWFSHFYVLSEKESSTMDRRATRQGAAVSSIIVQSLPIGRRIDDGGPFAILLCDG
jgi:hypothetical protein